MREKRVNLVVLSCSVLVATCASLSYCLVTAESHLSFLDKYVGVISTAIPLFINGHISTASAKTEVWIPSEEAVNTDGSVTDEFAEVAHVFARPNQRVVKPREEDEFTEQPVPWTSLKNEWKIYQKIQSVSQQKKEALEKNKKQEQVADDDDDEGSSEEDDGDEDEDEDEEEEDDPEARSAIPRARPSPSSEERVGPPAMAAPSVEAPVAKAKKEGLPLAFYGQQNHDDDERDFFKDEQEVLKNKKQGKKESEEEEEEEDDEGTSKEVASVEDYADYAVDDDDDVDEDEEKDGQRNKQEQDLGYDQIPLAIREMILNDLANQNNGSGYHPSLTPQVTGGNSQSQVAPSAGGGPPTSVENDDASGEENSSEEDEEEDDDVAVPPPLYESEPTPPAVVPSPIPKKGDDDEDDEVFDEGEDGGGKKGKGKGKGKKGKKGKKNKQGWGKPKGWGWKPPIHLPPPKQHGWGWDPAKHDGVLEQLVKGSTWERVLKYYHYRRDHAVKHEGEQHGHDQHKHHHGGQDHEHPGLELAGLAHPIGDGWGSEPESGIKKVVKGALKGSFWERAFKTYAKYKENQAKNPKKPTLLDLDTDQLLGGPGGPGHR